MLVIGAVALVVIGPKDLPKALRSVGEAVGKIKRMAAEFQGQFNDAMREAELHDLKKQLEDVGGSVQAATKVDFNPIQTIRDELKAAQPAADPSTPVADFKPQPIEPAIPLPEIPPPSIRASLPRRWLRRRLPRLPSRRRSRRARNPPATEGDAA